MVFRKSEFEKQQHTLAMLNLLVSTLILLVAVVWMAKSTGWASAQNRASVPNVSTPMGASEPSQDELLLQTKLLLNALKVDCAVVVMLPGEGILATRSDCARAPGAIREPSKAGAQVPALPVMAALGLDTLRQVRENTAHFIAL